MERENAKELEKKWGGRVPQYASMEILLNEGKTEELRKLIREESTNELMEKKNMLLEYEDLYNYMFIAINNIKDVNLDGIKELQDEFAIFMATYRIHEFEMLGAEIILSDYFSKRVVIKIKDWEGQYPTLVEYFTLLQEEYEKQNCKKKKGNKIIDMFKFKKNKDGEK